MRQFKFHVKKNDWPFLNRILGLLFNRTVPKIDSDLVGVSDDIVVLDNNLKLVSDELEVIDSNWRVALDSDEIVLSDSVVKTNSDIVVLTSDLRIAINSDEKVLSDNIVKVDSDLNYLTPNHPHQDVNITAHPEFGYINITDESNGYQIDGTRVLSAKSSNIFVGASAGNFIMTGINNTCWGASALDSNTTGSYNVAMGSAALTANTTGEYNIGIGKSALGTNISGSWNIGIGDYALWFNKSGIDNVAIGASTLLNSVGNENTAIGVWAGNFLTTGEKNIFIGFDAGKNQTINNNLLIIDNQDRGSDANEIINCLIYGVFNANPANQTLRLNAAVTGMNFISNIAIGTSPYACISTTLNINLNADLLDGQHASDFQVAGNYLLNVVEDTSPQLGGDLDGQSIYDLTNIVDAEFEGFVGIGTAPDAERLKVLNIDKSINIAGNKYGLYLTMTNTRNTGVTVGNTFGLGFLSQWYPELMSANKIMASMDGCFGQCKITTVANETYNATIVSAYCFYSNFLTVDGTGATGIPKFTDAYHYFAGNPTLSLLGQITTTYAFYDVGQIKGGTNWGLGINTQSYINANLSIGKNTTPAYPLDVVGDINSSTGFRCGGTAPCADNTYANPTSITTKGGIITAIS